MHSVGYGLPSEASSEGDELFMEHLFGYKIGETDKLVKDIMDTNPFEKTSSELMNTRVKPGRKRKLAGHNTMTKDAIKVTITATVHVAYNLLCTFRPYPYSVITRPYCIYTGVAKVMTAKLNKTMNIALANQSHDPRPAFLRECRACANAYVQLARDRFGLDIEGKNSFANPPFSKQKSVMYYLMTSNDWILFLDDEGKMKYADKSISGTAERKKRAAVSAASEAISMVDEQLLKRESQ